MCGFGQRRFSVEERGLSVSPFGKVECQGETLLRCALGQSLQETKNEAKGFRITVLGKYIQAASFPGCQLASAWQGLTPASWLLHLDGDRYSQPPQTESMWWGVLIVT